MIFAVTALVLAWCPRRDEGCLCAPTAWVRIGPVVETDAGPAVLDGTTLGARAPDAAYVFAVDAGATVLVAPQGALPVSANGRVQCGLDDYELVATQYAQALVDQNCAAALADAGFVQPPCHDTGYACGCSLSAAELSLALLVALALKPRQRRSSGAG